jgi:hypothetical protein
MRSKSAQACTGLQIRTTFTLAGPPAKSLPANTVPPLLRFRLTASAIHDAALGAPLRKAATAPDHSIMMMVLVGMSVECSAKIAMTTLLGISWAVRSLLQSKE